MFKWTLILLAVALVAAVFGFGGIAGAAATDPALAKGLSTIGGHLVNKPVAQAHGLPYQDPTDLLSRD